MFQSCDSYTYNVKMFKKKKDSVGLYDSKIITIKMKSKDRGSKMKTAHPLPCSSHS